MDLTLLIGQYLGDTPVVYMIAGLSLLVLINLGLTVYISSQTEEIHFNVFKKILYPLLQDSLLLVATQSMVVAVSKVTFVYEAFYGLGVLVFVTVLIKYYRSIRINLKVMGMTNDEKADQAIESKIDSILGVTSMLDEMIASKQNQNEVVEEEIIQIDEYTEEQVEVQEEPQEEEQVEVIMEEVEEVRPLSKEAEESFRKRESEE